jgi:PTH1 family peptidyl-tRNA hydrolase
MWLVVGLGNPGAEYAETRHNVGFQVVDRLAAKLRLHFTERRAQSLVARGQARGEPLLLAKPQTYMNLSGQAVRKLVVEFRLPLGRLLVVYEDFDLPLGAIRIRPGGGPGTHNGMRSIVAELGRTDFPRLRVGVGPLPEGVDPANFVLTPFAPVERAVAAAAIEQAGDCVLTIVFQGLETAMNRCNRSGAGATRPERGRAGAVPGGPTPERGEGDAPTKP